MNDNPLGNTQTREDFVLRRLEEPFPFFQWQLPEWMWLVCLCVVLALALVYVSFMYRKDAKGVGFWWASFLGLLRVSVYAILALVFLLPARQTSVVTKTESKVILVWDVSDSMHTSDDLPTGVAGEKLITRMDQLLTFLDNKKVNFVQALEKKNPVLSYRLGAKLDDEYLMFAGGRVFTRKDRESPLLDKEGRPILPEPAPLSPEYLRAWLTPRSKVPDMPGASDFDIKRLANLADLNAKLVKERVPAGTNLGDTIQNVLNKELNSRVQGVVVFTDGRNNEGSPNAFRDLEARATAANVPIFVVGVGEDREKVKIEIADMRVPQMIQPEDKFRVATEVIGEGLAGQKLDVSMEITHVRTYKTKVKDKDGKLVEVEKEEELPITVVERENPDNPKATRVPITLGNKLTLKPAADAVLDRASPPRLTVEWQLDPVLVAAAAKRELEASKKWELGETKEDSEFRFVVKVPTDKREGLDPKKKFHDGPRGVMKVIKKPLRVLLMAAGANRDYQFVRSMFVREVEKKRMELSVYLQLPPGEITYRPGRVQDVPPERMLNGFPDSFKAKKDVMDLQSYDVIVAFDPDWKQIQPDQIKLLKAWAEAGGGLILVGGYINTVELIRPREGEDATRYEPVLNLLPVELDDRRDYIERKADDPWALDLGDASPEMEFLKLDEELDESKFKEDWQAFFYGVGKDRTDKPQRGFFGFYPVKKVKTGSVVIARYTDPAAKMADNTMHPYMVTTPEALPRVVWIGSAESWRLREYREAFHERFWTKLVRYAAAKSKGTTANPIRIEMGERYPSLRYVDVEAKIENSSGEPLDRSAKPEITLKLPPGVPEKEFPKPVVMVPRPGAKDGWFSGRFQVRSPGEYELTVKVPRGTGVDSEMINTRKFVVTESNPELDDTKPDFDRLYRLASEATLVINRVPEDVKTELRRQLQRPRPKVAEGAEKEKNEPSLSDKPRLYFNLKNAELIPACMNSDVQTATSKGPHTDLWDDGITIVPGEKPDDPSKPEKKPIKISYVLLLVVGLLSVEWLTRKLLRLA